MEIISKDFSTLDIQKYLLYLCGITFIGTVIQNPLHVILVKRQISHNNISTYTYFKQILKNNKKLFFRGFSINMIGMTISQTLYLYCFEYFKYFHYYKNNNLNILSAGMISDLISRSIYYPFFLINTKQIAYKKNINFLKICNKVYKEKGILYFYKGFYLYIVYGSLLSGIWWVLYEKSKYIIYNNNMIANSACSINSTVLTTFLFNPCILVVSKIQANKNITYKNIIINLYTQGGIKQFWKSTPLNISLSVFDDLFLCFTYEYAKLWSSKTII